MSRPLSTTPRTCSWPEPAVAVAGRPVVQVIQPNPCSGRSWLGAAWRLGQGRAGQVGCELAAAPCPAQLEQQADPARPVPQLRGSDLKPQGPEVRIGCELQRVGEVESPLRYWQVSRLICIQEDVADDSAPACESLQQDPQPAGVLRVAGGRSWTPRVSRVDSPDQLWMQCEAGSPHSSVTSEATELRSAAVAGRMRWDSMGDEACTPAGTAAPEDRSGRGRDGFHLSAG